MKFFLSFALLVLPLVAVSTVSTAEQACQSDVSKFGGNVEWSLLVRSRFLAFDTHFGELRPECQQALLPILGKTDPCLPRLAELCTGVLLNRPNRSQCRRQHIAALPVTCLMDEIKQCTASGRETPGQSYCKKLIKGRADLFYECGAEAAKFCHGIWGEDRKTLHCLRFHYPSLSERCGAFVYATIGRRNQCWIDIHRHCKEEDLQLKRWSECLAKIRKHLSPACVSESRTTLIYQICAVGAHPDCNLPTLKETLSCLKGKGPSLAPACLEELRLQGEVP